LWQSRIAHSLFMAALMEVSDGGRKTLLSW